MKFLQELLNQLKKFTRAEQSKNCSKELPKELASNEFVARFIFEKRNIYSDGKTPKKNSFMPEFYKDELETSVCRNTNITEQRIWHLSQTVRHPLVALARADLAVAAILKYKLKANSAPQVNINYHEHSVIIGWQVGEENKAMRMHLAQQLASESKVFFYPK